MRENILIVEDDMDISDILKFSLEKENFNVRITPNGLSVERLVNEFKPDLILLDIMLNDIDGFQVCKEIVKYKVPIIMITARNEIIDKILGLELGADDYITKPFDIREVVARVRVAIRRRKEMYRNEKDNILNYGEIVINEDSREVLCNEVKIKLKRKELDLLIFLIKNINIVLSRDKILELVWDYDFIGDSRTVDVHITRLRKKLDKKINIETIFGVGYILKEQL